MILPRDHIFAGLPARSAGAILADVPWHFRCHTDDVGSRDPRRYYRTMSIADICALPVADIAAKDCHLFLWVTGPMLELSFDVIREWGFTYSAIAFTWVKLKKGRILASVDDLHVGLGYTTRKNTELCLLARRGNSKRCKGADVRELIVAPRREHSRKPDEIYGRIEEYCAGPYVELFARSSRKGWRAWGAEATKFDLPMIEAAE
jgi:N6-adenosine-specific RNA methylase IME4